MCDYSLTGLRNRLANEGEQLVVHRFHTGAVGLASPVDLLPSTHRRSWWPTLLAEKSVCAVCVPPGARLLLRNIPKDLQRTFGVGAEEEVTFVQVSLKEYTPRDAVEFQNGRHALLWQLEQGQRVEVLSLSLAEAAEAEHSLARAGQ